LHRHLHVIAEHGRMGWQKASGYNWRALVEADIGRWKRVIGHALRSQTDKRQATEVAIAVAIRSWDAPATSASHKTERARDHCVHPADPCNKVPRRSSPQRAGEPPSVPLRVSSTVLALTVGLVLRLTFHPGAALTRVRVVGIDIVYVDD
jgi:hypothetical protein